MKTIIDYLFRIEPPWIYIGCGELERTKWLPSYFYSCDGVNVCVRSLRGKKMQTTHALMDEFAASLQFFDGFGENWNALGDCLVCLNEWLPADAYVLVVQDAQELLLNEGTDQMEALLKTLHDSAESWAKPVTDNDRFNRNAIPFHVLMIVADNELLARDKIIHIAREANVPIRL